MVFRAGWLPLENLPEEGKVVGTSEVIMKVAIRPLMCPRTLDRGIPTLCPCYQAHAQDPAKVKAGHRARDQPGVEELSLLSADVKRLEQIVSKA